MSYPKKEFRAKLKISIMGTILLFLFNLNYAAAMDPGTGNLNTTIVIQNVTEDEIFTEDGVYIVPYDARIYDQDGVRVELRYLSTPCVAQVIYEPQLGQALPLVSEIDVVEVLPDRELHRYRQSAYPE